MKININLVGSITDIFISKDIELYFNSSKIGVEDILKELEKFKEEKFKDKTYNILENHALIDTNGKRLEGDEILCKDEKIIILPRLAGG